MEEKDIFRISIIGGDETEKYVRCDIDDKYFNMIASVIVNEIKRHPGFEIAMERAQMDN